MVKQWALGRDQSGKVEKRSIEAIDLRSIEKAIGDRSKRSIRDRSKKRSIGEKDAKEHHVDMNDVLE